MNKSMKLSILFSQIVFFIFFPVWIELTKYLHSIVIVVVWVLILFVFLFGVSWIRKEEVRISKRSLNRLIFLYALVLLILLYFRPGGANNGSVNLIPLETISYYLTDSVSFLIALYNLGANIGLFIPFGLYYRYVKNAPSMMQLILISIGSISLIEFVQFLTRRGSLDIDDLILNVLGVFLGYIIFPVFRKVFVIR
ncbi:teicoplanin resistance protein VanZ [Ureibacillus manganicus DSM 26584]|uniref:Teicoplanin resistance protein VanZ n=2 Tax=Ureibacillus TaxID=160795 RepID=A0A0A3HZY2_9BACL|nr:teicoplanin resistance protein VanZ [Ureibacillus manganicus DSM 26584]